MQFTNIIIYICLPGFATIGSDDGTKWRRLSVISSFPILHSVDGVIRGSESIAIPAVYGK